MNTTVAIEYKAVETAIKRLEGRVAQVDDPRVRRAVGELKADVKKADTMSVQRIEVNKLPLVTLEHEGVPVQILGGTVDTTPDGEKYTQTRITSDEPDFKAMLKRVSKHDEVLCDGKRMYVSNRSYIDSIPEDHALPASLWLTTFKPILS